MCGFHVIDSVHKACLGRRRALAGIGACLLGASVSRAEENSRSLPAKARPVDLTHVLHPGFPTYFGDQQFWAEKQFTLSKDDLNLNVNKASEHVGTHLDAPLHFSDEGDDVSSIDISRLVVPFSVIDIRKKAAGNSDAQVTPEDIRNWIKTYGPLPESGCVAMNSGWSDKVSKQTFRGIDAENRLHFPGFHEDAAQLLMEESETIGIAVDTLSLDYGPSVNFETHRVWLPSGRWGIECVANLDKVPASGAIAVVGALKIANGTGGQCRVIALI